MSKTIDRRKASHHILDAYNSTHLYLQLRRIFDVVFSAVAIILLLPLFCIISILVMLDVGRAVIFVQIRPGRHMRPFKLYKFRTMRSTYNSLQLSDYERTSPFGRLLRRVRLDELPQLYNVLIGDMSLIGPRPLLPRDLPRGPIVNERATLRPGITGWAQVHGGRQLEITEKIALDNWYACHANPAVDVKILILTIKMMIWGERATASSPNGPTLSNVRASE